MHLLLLLTIQIHVDIEPVHIFVKIQYLNKYLNKKKKPFEFTLPSTFNTNV